ncbi:hypothetical protein J416_15417 [Gracilibacillus halophilus YIM-C55.5]|uniref:N-acetyltransferase domain-containing protein n=1 Tax=Gracilibacillus halophilus YIM-C55.5 TaxID=1308866 RepID=N4WHB9_9BACI|nr:hypothetical protein [Gracilibacillus halophilus]ENH95567.1 hypothetical protein J416_15417 [Gracilibacillus halophilus YIM-C55.5]
MELQATKTVDSETFQAFFGDSEKIQITDEMKQYGYFICDQEETKGFFALYPVQHDAYWLRTFIMKQGVTVSLPLTMIQTAEQLTYNYGAHKLFIHSDSDALDQLLHQLSYQQTDEAPEAIDQGTWWMTYPEKSLTANSYTQEKR